MMHIPVPAFNEVRRIMRIWGYNPYDTALLWSPEFIDWLTKRTDSRMRVL